MLEKKKIKLCVCEREKRISKTEGKMLDKLSHKRCHKNDKYIIRTCAVD